MPRVVFMSFMSLLATEADAKLRELEQQRPGVFVSVFGDTPGDTPDKTAVVRTARKNGKIGKDGKVKRTVAPARRSQRQAPSRRSQRQSRVVAKPQKLQKRHLRHQQRR